VFFFTKSSLRCKSLPPRALGLVSRKNAESASRDALSSVAGNQFAADTARKAVKTALNGVQACASRLRFIIILVRLKLVVKTSLDWLLIPPGAATRSKLER
jgi:hypothetical protein